MIYKKISFILLFVSFTCFSQDFTKYKITEDQKVEDFCKIMQMSFHDYKLLNPNLNDSLLFKGDKPIIINMSFDSQLPNTIRHKVKRKQTLESISNLYNVSKELLISFNDLKQKNLKKGTIIEIPTNSILNNNSTNINKLKQYKVIEKEGKWRVAYKFGITIDQLEFINDIANQNLKVDDVLVVPNIDYDKINKIDDKFAYYRVMPKEGYFKLMEKFNLSEQTLKKLNPILKTSNLINGMVIKLPKNISNKQDLLKFKSTNLLVDIDNSKKRSIALLLPFGVENINFDSISIAKNQLKNDKLLNLSVDFYLGVKTAIDSLSKLGLSIELNVFDTNQSSKSDIYKIINNNEWNNYDFVIGPLTKAAFDYTSNLLINSPAYIVSPLSKAIDRNNVINTITSDSILSNRIISFFESDTTRSKKYIISDSENLISSNKLKEKFSDAVQIYSTINDLGIDTKSLVLDDLDSTFVDPNNIIFLETKDQGFVSNVTSILNSFVNDSVAITLTTTIPTKAFSGSNISNYFLSNLNFHYPSYNKPINYDLNNVFIDNFIKKYNYVPNKYVLRGFDLTLDLLLKKSSNKLFLEPNSLLETYYIENKFKFYPNRHNKGLKNISTFIVKYENLDVTSIE
ncbi:MAG: LysM peptidoglycan-binding domain-containing protein [Flavobacteriaceae bacterium]|nr:LysM peptidoglycan-binding domain-containing protein [Flavobacteriaceae bacterium]